jgi:hypothetical protein
MFSITPKRSAATLGVVAGLLAAAGPASAQALPGMVGFVVDGPITAKAGPAPSQLGAANDISHLSATAPVTRDNGANTIVGGDEADTLHGEASAGFTLDVASSEVFELNTFGGNDTLTVDAGTGDDKIWNNGDGNDLNTARRPAARA